MSLAGLGIGIDDHTPHQCLHLRLHLYTSMLIIIIITGHLNNTEGLCYEEKQKRWARYQGEPSNGDVHPDVSNGKRA